MSLESTPPTAPSRVLEDASGKRRRFLRRVGRAIALLLVVWLCAVFLGGIGFGPATHLPFGHLLRPTLAPPALQHAPHVSRPHPADLVAALPAATARVQPTTTAARAKGTSAAAAATGRAAATTTTRGSSAATTTRGKSATAPGHTKTTTRTNTHSNRPAAPPGLTKTTTRTVTHGNRPAAPPGQTRTNTNRKNQ